MGKPMALNMVKVRAISILVLKASDFFYEVSKNPARKKLVKTFPCGTEVLVKLMSWPKPVPRFSPRRKKLSTTVTFYSLVSLIPPQL